MDLIHRQEIWVLTAQGWLLTCLVVMVLILFILTRIHSFLALNAPIKADILVVEGWIQDYAVKNAIAEFERGGYQKLITTGLALEQGYYLAEYKSSAELSAATLIALGFNPDKVVAVPAPNVVINRTTASARALRQWLADSDLKIKAINIYTFDAHTRRSWLIFKQVLAPEIEVGAIPAISLGYNPKRWWMSSEGVRSILSEAIAYLYARFINWRS